ncbi:MAG: hypothetical protein JW795_12170 [Chitinivibrionales bacterium]|nr:hypothetical protein [Chitinivibrionales bacterium]
MISKKNQKCASCSGSGAQRECAALGALGRLTLTATTLVKILPVSSIIHSPNYQEHHGV